MSLYSYCIQQTAEPRRPPGVSPLLAVSLEFERPQMLGVLDRRRGPKRAHLGVGTSQDISGRIVSATKVMKNMTMPEYDDHAKTAGIVEAGRPHAHSRLARRGFLTEGHEV